MWAQLEHPSGNKDREQVKQRCFEMKCEEMVETEEGKGIEWDEGHD